jgi:hypothetical protein
MEEIENKSTTELASLQRCVGSINRRVAWRMKQIVSCWHFRFVVELGQGEDELSIDIEVKLALVYSSERADSTGPHGAAHKPATHQVTVPK